MLQHQKAIESVNDSSISQQVRDRLPHLKMIVQYSPEPVDQEQQDQGVVSWEEFIKIGKVSLPVMESCESVSIVLVVW